MKAETKAKIRITIRKIGEAVKPWIVPTLLLSTISAAWAGYVQSEQNRRHLKEVEQWRERYTTLGLANAENVCELNDRLTELENQNQKLLNDAMNITEGKESA